MGKFEGILLCSDFDGTFASGGVVPEENMKAIRYFRENGGLFTLASGRNYDFLAPIFDGYEFGVPMININGAVIYDFDKRKILSERTMSSVSKEKIETIVREVRGIEYISFFSRSGLDFVDVAGGEMPSDGIYSELYKFAVRIKGDKSESDSAKQIITEIMRGHCVERSSSNYIEVLEPLSTKAPNTLALKKAVGAQTLICVGDYENDIGMIRGADIGYAVLNAIDDVKAVADRITVSAEDAAIASIIKEL